MKVGVIGAGQLGQMLGLAGKRLDIEFTFLDPAREPPARIVGNVIHLPFDDDSGLRQLALDADVLTYEFENVPVEAIDKIGERITVYPPSKALELAQDRIKEKRLFEALGIPVAIYVAVDSEADARAAVDSIGLPLVLKTRRLGYDGKGQAIVKEASEITDAYASLRGKSLIAEQWIEFDREVSAIGARNADGELAIYPLTENIHRDGILRISRAPVAPDHIVDQAIGYLTKLLEHLNYVGVLALEFFVRNGRLYANEFAPRVHNSGHWTIEGAATSQFENHLRAILDMSLGETSPVAHVGMINLIGNMPASWNGDSRRHLHDYGKAPRPGRKLGHITILADSPDDRDQELDKILEKLAA